MSRVRVPIVAALLLMCAVTLGDKVSSDSLTEGYRALLTATVKDGKLDYARIARDHERPLNEYIDRLATLDLSGLGDSEKLAYYINLYNATMLKAVIDGGASFKPSDQDFDVFKRPLVRTKGGAMSLNDLENKVIRPTFKDARIHAALVCAAVSCPPLIDVPYAGVTLSQQLDENVKRWLADPNRNQIDDANKELRLSKIFDWYAEDFGGKGNVAKWVAEKTGRDVSGYKVEFVEYDWSLNSR